MTDDKRFEALELRVTYLEREAIGEKDVSRHILRETRANTDSLVLLTSRMGRVEARMESLEKKIDGFPRMVADVMREVMAEHKS